MKFKKVFFHLTHLKTFKIYMYLEYNVSRTLESKILNTKVNHNYPLSNIFRGCIWTENTKIHYIHSYLHVITVLY